MQSIDDDMEELFKRAGEEYPLNTSGADWNKVAVQLHDSKDDVAVLYKKRQKDYRYLLLLLLFPLGIICGKYTGDNKKEDITVATQQKNSNKETQKSGKRIAEDIKATSRDEELPVANKALIKEKKGNSVTSNIAKKIIGKTAFTANNIATAKKANQPFLNLKSYSLQTKIFTGEKIVTRTNSGKQVTKDVSIANNKNFFINKSAEVNQANNNTNTNNNNQHTNSSPVVISGSIESKAINTVDTPKQTKPEDEKIKSVNNKPGNLKRKLFYSFVFGPDVSTVKFYKTSKVGYSIGVLLSYAITSKLTVEAGGLWDRKNYYAQGKYLDTGKLQLPMHSVVSKVDSYCDMIEVPVNFKFDVITKQHHAWFASAGLSSYFMKSEDYNVSYERYNQSYVKEYGYKNSSNNWFGIMNLSAGYKTFVGKQIHLSVAPYIKLPLGGIGIGKLPITSTGVYISISHPFH